LGTEIKIKEVNYMPDKIDLKKEYKKLYNPSDKTPEIIEVPEFKFLMIDGKGIDNEEFQFSIQALFGVSYKVKFMIKKEKSIDYVVMPLEGLWWADSMNDFLNGNKETWKWTLMIMQPDFVKEEIIHKAIKEVKNKKSIASLDNLRFEKYEEGISGQIMHVGPFSEEHQNIVRIHKLIEESGGKFNGKIQKHHEIYLNDFRKTTPEKLKTVLRQPFNK
jgi:hypothetical protein